MEFKIYRYDPDKDSKPRYDVYVVQRNQIQGQMLLHALEHIKTIDSTLSFRRSCDGYVL